MATETEKRLLELHRNGCPGCGQKEEFGVTCTEIWLRDVHIVDNSLEWGNFEWGDDVSDDFINCRECDWEEQLTAPGKEADNVPARL